MKSARYTRPVLRLAFALLASVSLSPLLLAAPPDGKGGGKGGGGDDGTPPNPEIAFADTDGVYLMDADGGNVTQILQAGVRFPSWSPDGSQLAVRGNLSDGLGIYRLNSDGTNLNFVAPLFESSVALDWSPRPTASGGELIVFYDLHPELHFNLFVVAPDGSGYQALTNSTREELYPTWSPDGQQIVYVRDFVELVVADVGFVDGTIALVSETVVYAGPGRDLEMICFPRFSNDGQRIVFSRLDRTQSRNSSTGKDLALIDLDQPGVVTMLTNIDHDERWASFSPDDSKIAFHESGSRGGIFVINADGSGRTKLTRQGFDPYWRRTTTQAKAFAPSVTATAPDCPADLDGDGRVDVDDLLEALDTTSNDSARRMRPGGSTSDSMAQAIIAVLASWGGCP